MDGKQGCMVMLSPKSEMRERKMGAGFTTSVLGLGYEGFLTIAPETTKGN